MNTTVKFWLQVAHDFGFDDKIATLGNIIDTSDGSNMRAALELWCHAVSDQYDAIPPDLDSCIKDQQFGTEL